MATVKIRFDHPLNISVQVTDILYGTKGGGQSGINNTVDNHAP